MSKLKDQKEEMRMTFVAQTWMVNILITTFTYYYFSHHQHHHISCTQVLDVVEMPNQGCPMNLTSVKRFCICRAETHAKLLFSWACLMINPFEAVDPIDFTKFETLITLFSATTKRLKLVLTQAQTEQGAE